MDLPLPMQHRAAVRQRSAQLPPRLRPPGRGSPSLPPPAAPHPHGAGRARACLSRPRDGPASAPQSNRRAKAFCTGRPRAPYDANAFRSKTCDISCEVAASGQPARENGSRACVCRFDSDRHQGAACAWRRPALVRLRPCAVLPRWAINAQRVPFDGRSTAAATCAGDAPRRLLFVHSAAAGGAGGLAGGQRFFREAG